MSDQPTPGSVEALYRQLACERAGRARAELVCQPDVERLLADSAQALEDAAAVLLHAATAFVAMDGALPETFAERAGELLAVAGAVRGGGRPQPLYRSSRRAEGSQAMTSLRYCDADGARHEVAVGRTASADWQVLDTSAAETRIVETLDGDQDGREQAEAVARDYAENVHRLGWTPGRAAAERIPEQGRADATGDRSPQPRSRTSGARAAALSRPAA